MRRLVIFWLLFLCTFCSSLSQRRKIVIGINDNSPPFGFYNSGGKLVGVDIEIAKALAKELHADFELRPIEGMKREQLLNGDSIDFIVGIYSVTEERKKKVHFSNPYYEADVSLGLLFRRTSGIRKPTDVRNKSYSVSRNSTAYFYDQEVLSKKIQQHYGQTATPVIFNSHDSVFSALFRGQVDAIIHDFSLLVFRKEQDPGSYELIPLKDSGGDQYAIGINKRNVSDTTAINNLVARLTSRQPEETQVEEWIGFYNQQELYNEKWKERLNYLVLILSISPLLWLLVLRVKSKVRSRQEGGAPVGVSEVKRPEHLNTVGSNVSGENYAWFIANSKYTYMPNLGQFPMNEATLLKGTLQKYGFKDENIFIQPNATRSQLINGFNDLASRKNDEIIPFVSKLKNSDNLLIYYSGHGHLQGEEDIQTCYWVPINGKDLSDYISDSEIRDYVNKLALNHILLISDSCFAATLFNAMRDALPLQRKIKTYMENPCIEVLTSGAGHVPADSLFAIKLNEILRKNEARYLTVDQIATELRLTLHDSDYYDPSNGSFSKSARKGRFVFVKEEAIEKEQLKDQSAVRDIEQMILKACKKKITPYDVLIADLAIEKSEIDTGLLGLANRRFIEIRFIEKRKVIYVTKAGEKYLRYG